MKSLRHFRVLLALPILAGLIHFSHAEYKYNPAPPKDQIDNRLNLIISIAHFHNLTRNQAIFLLGFLEDDEVANQKGYETCKTPKEIRTFLSIVANGCQLAQNFVDVRKGTFEQFVKESVDDEFKPWADDGYRLYSNILY